MLPLFFVAKTVPFLAVIRSDVGNVINAYFVACMKAMATLAGAMGKTDEQQRFGAQVRANVVLCAMCAVLSLLFFLWSVCVCVLCCLLH